MIATDKTIGQLVLERPGRARVFERLGIDYCCGGKKPLRQACQERGMDPRAVVQVIEVYDRQDDGRPSERDWSVADLTELADHIEQTHHAYLKRELPRLEQLLGKIAAVHGQRRPEVRELEQVFRAFKAELESHMAKEEQVLFPLCRRMAWATRAGVALPAFHCGSVQNPIRVMIAEHEHAGAALARMRELTGGYVPPEGACNTYRAALHALEELEKDMHQHVHKENNILFPRAAGLEAAARGLSN
jgi:regulator of cell morphogenesis and NO signaling